MFTFLNRQVKGHKMEYQEINSIIDEMDKSIDKQINLISLQLSELKEHLSTVEKLLIQIRLSNSL